MWAWASGGRLFPPADEPAPWWLGRHAALPCADLPRDATDEARIYFSGRDDANRAHIGACSVTLSAMAVVAGSTTREPLVAPGPPGSFDESGCTMSCLVRRGERIFLYYTGWRLGRTVPFYFQIGLAVSDDDGRSFTKVALLGPTPDDPGAPVLQASPWVLVEDGRWRMWYVSGTHWEAMGDTWRHYYLVRSAESLDGLVWHDRGVALPFAGPDEHAIGRPCVVRDGDGYHMWYCHRGAAYRIGYARSEDGTRWQRLDGAAGIAPPATGWDSEMQAYPVVFRHRGRWLMLYNGNGYGATGFGWAAARDSGPLAGR